MKFRPMMLSLAVAIALTACAPATAPEPGPIAADVPVAPAQATPAPAAPTPAAKGLPGLATYGGKPLAGAAVSAFVVGGAAESIVSLQTDAEGRFALDLPGIPQGALVRVTAAFGDTHLQTHLTVTAGRAVAQAAGRLTLDEVSTLAGILLWSRLEAAGLVALMPNGQPTAAAGRAIAAFNTLMEALRQALSARPDAPTIALTGFTGQANNTLLLAALKSLNDQPLEDAFVVQARAIAEAVRAAVQAGAKLPDASLLASLSLPKGGLLPPVYGSSGGFSGPSSVSGGGTLDIVDGGLVAPIASPSAAIDP